MGDLAAQFYATSQHLKGFDLARFCSLWARLIETGAGVIFVADDGTKLRGAIGGVAYPDPYSGRSAATEFFWFVSPESRGCGLKLYREFECWAREQACSEIQMVYLSDSMPERLRATYERLGFHEVETRYAKELTS